MKNKLNKRKHNRTPEEQKILERGLICGDDKSYMITRRGSMKDLVLYLNRKNERS